MKKWQTIVIIFFVVIFPKAYSLEVDENNVLLGQTGIIAPTYEDQVQQFGDVPLTTEEVFTFPATGDPRFTSSGYNFWNAGDYVEGSRLFSIATDKLHMELAITTNYLSCDIQDHILMVDGVTIGDFFVGPGDTLVIKDFSFLVITPGNHTIRIETTRTVKSGCGSAGFPNDVSKMVAIQMTMGTCLGLTCTINGKPSETIMGTNNDDVICGTDKADIILGKGGNDTICGDAGDDIILADNGHDRVDGGSGNDVLDGGTGMDMLEGGSDNDVLLGGNDGDLLYGGMGFDYLSGGLGQDMLNGGPDNDICEKENSDKLLVSCESMVSSTNMSVLTLDKDLVSPELANALNILKPEMAK